MLEVRRPRSFQAKGPSACFLGRAAAGSWAGCENRWCSRRPGPHSGAMRIMFPRLPDYEKAYAVIERDDGVVYRLYGGVAGSSLPHDVRHLVVEGSLGITDGLWGRIAA